MNTVLRIVIGFVFIFSAVAKLYDIDHFELYVFSFKLLSFDIAAIFSRIIIAFEFALGSLFVIGVFRKTVFWIGMLTLSIFSFFLLILGLSGNSENCNCFGELLELGPWDSLFKNLVLIILLLLIKKQKPAIRRKWNIFALIPTIIISASIPFIISPPDFIYYSNYSEVNRVFDYGKASEESQQILKDFFEEYPLNDKVVLCFYSTKCEYCKKLARKLTLISEKFNFSDKVINVFAGTQEGLTSFYRESKSKESPHVIIPIIDFIRLTNGSMPIVYLIDDGKVKYEFGYRNLSEKELVEFFKSGNSN